MRYLAVDLGDKRTGLAVGDDETGIVSPATLVRRPLAGADEGADLLREIENEAKRYGADALVVGLPLNMDGTEGPRAATTRAFATRLERATGCPVILHDERLTSAEADWSMAGSGMTHRQKKQRRDALAAAAMLRSYLAQESPGEGDS